MQFVVLSRKSFASCQGFSSAYSWERTHPACRVLDIQGTLEAGSVRRSQGRTLCGQCPVTPSRLIFWRKFESSTAMSIQTVHLPPTSTLTATPSFPTAHSAYRRNKRPFQAQGRLRCLSPASEAYRRNKRRLQFGVVRGTRLYLPNTPSMKRIDFSVSHFDGDLVTVIGIARALPP